MSRSRTRHTRKKRRQQRAIQKRGRAAAPTHKGKSGRTGSMHSKKRMSALDAVVLQGQRLREDEA